MASPRKKSAVLKALEGNPGKRVIEASGIEGLGEPFIHEHLMDDARGCIEVIRQSMPPRVYSALDSYLLAAFGMAWAIHKRAALEISNRDFIWIAGVDRVSPWIKMLSQQAMIIASLGDRLGLDPRSRSALKLPGARQQKSKFDGLIGQIVPFPSSKT